MKAILKEGAIAGGCGLVVGVLYLIPAMIAHVPGTADDVGTIVAVVTVITLFVRRQRARARLESKAK